MKNFKKSLVASAITLAIFSHPPSVYAEAISANGRVEVSVKANKDLVTARKVARDAAERDAVRSALRVRLNLDPKNPKNEEAVAEIAKNLADNFQTTFATEGDILTARTTLQVDSAQLTDLARTLGLSSAAVMEASSILFLVDEYYGIATKLDPSQPLVSEVEYFHDKSSASDTSSKVAKSASSSSSLAASSKESSSLAASEKASVAASSSSSFAGSDRRSAAVADGMGGAAAASRDTRVAGSQKESFAGSSSSSVAATRDSDTRIAKSASQQSAYAAEQKNIQSQKDIVSLKTKTVFPDVGNAKPADDASALITQRLEQVTRQYGIQYTPERDFRVAGGRKLLVNDIEKLGQYDQYTQKASRNPFNAKYVVYGNAVMSSEGQTASGAITCSGMLKLSSFNVDTGRGLVSGTLNKRAQGSSDQDCRSNLATALATELAQTIGNAATRELQLIATQGQAYTVTLYSALRINRRVGVSFEEKLQEVAGNLREDKTTESSRTYIVQAKGTDFRRQIERMLDSLGDSMRDAEVMMKGNRLVICIEGKCPTDF
jgi:hypothetical protein